MSACIEVRDLVKTFTFPVKQPGSSWWKNLVHPETKTIRAVDAISFTVGHGETIACIGPNGAGKSTTIKMLTGILTRSAGSIRVLGLDPEEQRETLAYRIGTVFGQRSQLHFNLPVRDSFELFGAIYGLSEAKTKKRMNELVELFELEDVIHQPVRKLSLGQRMRAEIAVSLIHDPELIFLDEPTIGLDVVAKRKLRQTLQTLNREQGTTIFLTSHDTGDIEALCERTLVINHGRVILDTRTEELRRSYLTTKDIRLVSTQEMKAFRMSGVIILKREGTLLQLRVDTKKADLNAVLTHLLETYEIEDLDVQPASLEEVIERIYDHA